METEPTSTSDLDTIGAEVEAPATVAVETLVEEELLVEEISIDGMCGVY